MGGVPSGDPQALAGACLLSLVGPAREALAQEELNLI